MLDFEGTTLSDFTFSTGGLGEDILAVVTGNHGLGMAENNVSFVATSAFNIHEVGVRGGDESFQLMGLSFVLEGGVKQVSIHLWKSKYYQNIDYFHQYSFYYTTLLSHHFTVLHQTAIAGAFQIKIYCDITSVFSLLLDSTTIHSKWVQNSVVSRPRKQIKNVKNNSGIWTCFDFFNTHLLIDGLCDKNSSINILINNKLIAIWSLILNKQIAIHIILIFIVGVVCKNKINKFIYPTELQPMQFHNTWDSEFNRIVQGLAPCGASLCQTQLNSQNKNKPRGLAIRRQECRVINPEDLTQHSENYSPLSDIINWNELKAKNTFVVKKYRQCVYFGEIQQDKRTGLGVMLYTNNRVYEGYWKDNFKHGKGYEKFSNGAIYSGTYVNGKPEGYGTYSWQNGETYEGEWLDGNKNGSGIWRGPTGDSYIGEWKNGQANGYGVHTWVNGDRYEGEFKDCLKHGEGVEKFTNGDSYKGSYVMGKPHGYGEYYWAIGSYYKGDFQYGMRSGKGIWKRGPGNTDRYQGEYKDDKKEGFGTFVWENGCIYKGNFSNDRRNGYGEMFWTNGRSYKGEWVNNEQAGGIQEFSQKNEELIMETQRYRNQQIQTRSSRGRLKYKINERSIKEETESNFVEIKPGYFQEPYPPEMSETQRKFRAREIPTKRQPRTQSHKSSRSQNQCQHMQQPNKFVRKYSVGSRCSTNKKVKQGNSEQKMMSSTFFLYKIHSNSPALDQSYTKPRPRQVKTSGGMRQKHISQQIKYFTRNKINPEFL